MALPLNNTFETAIADETAITTGNSDDGSAGNAFTGVDAGGGSIVYDDLRSVAGGRLAAKVATGTGADRVQVQWDSTAMGSQTSVWGRVYVYRTVIPATEHQWLVRFEGTGGSGLNGLVVWTDSGGGAGGDLAVFDQDFAADAAGINLPYNEWVRIEFRLVTNAGAGTIEAVAYAGDSTTPLGSCGIIGTADTGNSCEAVSFGDANDASNVSDTSWIDGLNLNATGYPGPLAARTGRRYKRFVGPTALSSTPETLYTVPYNGRSVIRNIYANNPSSVDAALTLGIAVQDAYADEVLADSPAAYYRLGEGSGLPQDFSGNANHADAVGAGITYSAEGLVASDPSNNSLSFDGSTGWVTAPDHASLDITGELTLEAWIHPTALGALPTIFAKYDATNDGGYDLYVTSSGVIYVAIRGGGNSFEPVSAAGVIEAGNTYHVVVTYDDVNNGETLVYVNGVGISMSETLTGVSLAGNTADLSIGARGLPTPDELHWTGRIDEVAVYPSVLSAERVAAHYEAAQAPDGIFDEDIVPAGDILFARRDTNYVLEAGEMLQGFTTPVLNPSYAEEVLADSPEVYYRLGETSGTTYPNLGSAGSAANATANATIPGASGLISSDPSNGAGEFNWFSGTVFKATSTYTLSQFEPVTFEFWCKPRTLEAINGTDAYIITAGALGVQFADATGVWSLVTYGVKDYVFSTAPAAVVGVTQHIVVTLDAAHDASIYVNGQFVETVTHTAAPGASTDDVIIANLTGQTAGADAYLDEIAIYPSTLSAVRILAHYTAGIGRYASEVLADSPVGYWRMNEASGLIQDSSGNGNHATGSTGTPAYSQAGAILSSIYFNGDTMQVPDHSTLDVGDVFSLEAWVKRTTTGVQEVIFDKWTDTPAIHINSDNTFSLMLTNTEALAHSTSTITDTNWHHIVATKNGASIFLYLDGVDDTGTIDNTTACTNNTTRLEIGGTQLGTALCNSYLDELAWYGTVLSPERVAAHYAAATSFPLTPVLDDFNRANGALGSNWGVIFSGDGVPTIWTNAMVGVSSAENSAYWNVSTYEDCQVYCDMDDDTWGTVMARISDPNSGVENLMLGRFRADTDEILFGIVYNGALVTGDWLNTINVTVPAACQIGMTVTNDGNDFGLEFFIDGVSQGTYTVTNGAVSYPDLAAAGYIGAQLYGGGNTLDRSIDNFGGGSLSPVLVVDGVEYGL